jgi:hypothetical protein
MATILICEILGSHGGEYKDHPLSSGLLRSVVSIRPDDGGSKHLWNSVSFCEITLCNMPDESSSPSWVTDVMELKSNIKILRGS